MIINLILTKALLESEIDNYKISFIDLVKICSKNNFKNYYLGDVYREEVDVTKNKGTKSIRTILKYDGKLYLDVLDNNRKYEINYSSSLTLSSSCYGVESLNELVKKLRRNII